MRYLYKQTGVVVESGTALDSAVFAPVEKKAAEAEKKPQESRQSKSGKNRVSK